MRPHLAHLALAALFAMTFSLKANVTPAPPFQDNAVLQQGKAVPVWGTADPHEKITVEFHRQKKETIADATGAWRVNLDELKASSEPAEMVIAGNNNLRLKNLLVGEVWICAGQSNMAWPVKNSKDADKEIADSNYPLIRHFKTALTAAATPLASVKGEWEVCSPRTVGEFSAVAYFFGRELSKQLSVPIGLINISYGGSPIESWMSDATLRANSTWPAIEARLKQDQARYPARKKLYDERLATYEAKKAEADRTGAQFSERPPRALTAPDAVDRFTPSALYNAMLHPFIPFAIRGVTWFQGEANVYRSAEYRSLFPAMIQEWRSEFGQGDFPFYFVQMANQARASDPTQVVIAFLRESQMAGLKEPETGMVVTADIGDPNDNHFKNKQEVGSRLALIALTNTYGRTGEFSGPTVKDIAKTDTGFRVTFDHASGLKLTGTDGFELAGADQVFHPATAKVEGDTLTITSDPVSTPLAVRYAWRDNPAMTLYNGAGLPAPSFRSDNWLLPTTTGRETASDTTE